VPRPPDQVFDEAPPIGQTALQDQPPNFDEEQPPAQLPETEVFGDRRSGPFPAQPLPENAVVTPARTESDVRRIGSSLTVITEEQIRQSLQPAVADMLRGKLGVDIVQSGGPGHSTSIFLRGANSNQTKVLLDGIPLNSPLDGRFDFDLMTVDNLERVEVLRGPQSTLYGSDAIGGVVNMITKRGQGPPRAVFKTLGGTYGNIQEVIQAQAGNETAHVSVSAGWLSVQGFSVLRDNTERDAYKNQTFSARTGYTPSEDFDVDFVIRHTDAGAETDPGFGVAGVNLSDRTYSRLGVRRQLFEDWEMKGSLSINDNRLRDRLSLFGASDFEAQVQRLDWQNNFNLGTRHIFTAGLDAYHEKGTSSFLPTAAERDFLGVYVQDQWAVNDRLFLTGGGRWDTISTVGSARTYRVTGSYLIPETGTTLRGSLGTGFRAPALTELFLPIFGNPNLLPEKSKGWDYGIEQAFLDQSVVLGVTYFRNDFINLIQFNGLIPENVGRALATGLEVQSLIQVDQQTTCTISYTHTDTRDLATGLALLRRPRDKFGFVINRSFWQDRANLNVQLLMVGGRADVAFPQGRVDLARYTIMNLAGTYQWNDQVQLFARVDNLWNEDYEEVFGFSVPGCTVICGANVGTW